MNLADFHQRGVLGERVELEELNQRYRDQGGLPDAILLFIDLVYLQLISSFVTFFEFSLSLSYWICNRLTAFTLLVYFWFTVYFFYFFCSKLHSTWKKADFLQRGVIGEQVELEELNQRGGLPDAILLFIDLLYSHFISSLFTFFEFSLSLS